MQWNSDYTFLCFIPRSAKLNWVLTGVAAFLLWLFGALCAFVIIFDLFLKPSPQFSVINALILFMAAIFCWSYVFLVVLGHRYGEGLVAAFNEVLKFINEIDKVVKLNYDAIKSLQVDISKCNSFYFQDIPVNRRGLAKTSKTPA